MLFTLSPIVCRGFFLANAVDAGGAFADTFLQFVAKFERWQCIFLLIFGVVRRVAKQRKLLFGSCVKKNTDAVFCRKFL